jgi:cobalt/nickel transport system permease protein
VAFAGWFSVVMAALGCAGQLAWSGTVSWRAAFTGMAGIHMLIGLGEGLISALVFAAVARTRPDLLSTTAVERPSRRWMLYGSLVALGLAIFVAPFACPWPDGLESVAASLGFEHHAEANLLPAPAPDYVLPGIPWGVAATAAAGVIGSLIVLGLAWWLGRILVASPDAEPAKAAKGT